MHNKNILSSPEPTNLLIIEKIFNFIANILTPPPSGKELLQVSENSILEEPLLNN